MLLGAVLALAVPFWHRHEAPPQVLSGPNFEDLAQAVGRRCPVSEPDVRSARPARLLAVEDAFRAQLSGPARARLDERLKRTPDGRIAACQAQAGSCEAGAYLAAFRETRLDGAFVLYLCGHASRLR